MSEIAAFGGYLDFWGETGDAGTVALCGWLAQPYKAAAGQADLPLSIKVAGGTVQTRATGMVFARTDVAAVGFGAILLCEAPHAALEGMQWADIEFGQRTCRMQATAGTRCLDARAMQDALRPLVERATPVDHRAIALSCLSMAEDGYAGPTGSASASVEAMLDCSPAGALILAVLTASEPAVVRVGLTCGRERVTVPPSRLTIGEWRGVGPDLFRVTVTCLVDASTSEGPRWLEIELASGQTARAILPPARPGDRAALHTALSAFGVTHDMDRVFDNIAGIAIGALYAATRHGTAGLREATFGDTPRNPKASLVIPLHGRIDYMEVQIALFSAQPCMRQAEIIYVVDDPPRQMEAQALAASAFARMGVPCRLLLPSRNLGFAGASNAGLRSSGGDYICFLNSDAFPQTAGWLQDLVARLENDPALGIVGPLLLLPDGSVQHEGMVLERLQSHAGWHFPRHTRKGLRPNGSGLQHAQAITGACMVLRRSLALSLGGFDEAFVIGDFEDADLCMRTVRTGLACAVDRDVRALHLERKSQGAGASWREGATLYNAWLHERRWFPAAEAKPAATPARRRRG